MHEVSITVIVFIVAGLFILNALSYYSSKIKILPDIIWVLLLGVVYGFVAEHSSWGLPDVKLSGELVFYTFIPLLIFASTQKMCLYHFRTVLVPASLLGSLGILISMMVIGLSVHYLFGVPLVIALLFGVVVSATDPLAISALLHGNKQIDESTKLLIEGESILNDGFVVTVFGILYAISFEGERFNLGDASLDLVTHVVGAIVLGVVIARLARKILSAWHEEHFSLRTNMTLVVAYSSFIMAEAMHFSGILAVFSAALAYGYKPGSDSYDVHAQRNLWDYFEYLANACLFFLLGASVISFGAFNDLSLMLVLASIALVFIARCISLLGLWPVTWLDNERLNQKQFWLLNFAGARGAVSIALLLHLPNALAQKQLFISSAFIMILFSLIAYPVIMQKILDR